MPRNQGFTLGNHTFLEPGQQGRSERFSDPPIVIEGAEPPSYLAGRVRLALLDSAAAAMLLEGDFGGHGEPTVAVFDVILDGHEELEISVLIDDPDEEAGFAAVVARPPGGAEWFALFRRDWEEAQATLEGVEAEPLTADEAAAISDDVARGRVAIGFEYPCDADSRDCVSWISIDVALDDDDEPQRLVDAELA
ncbi:MAG: hypothetical protein ACF8R7_08900 [Phycisphaerales bacterium JB039]